MASLPTALDIAAQDDRAVFAQACGAAVGVAHALQRQHIDLAQELGDEAVGRPLVDLLRRADLLQLAVVEDGDARR